MGKLRVLSGKEVCHILEKHGFVEARRRGSHIAIKGDVRAERALLFGFNMISSRDAKVSQIRCPRCFTPCDGPRY